MAFFFGDGFDCYALPADTLLGYWDGATTQANVSLASGRFAGSRAFQPSSSSATSTSLFKNSGSNDAVHHIVCAYSTASTLTGTTVHVFFTLYDGATAQCSIAFRSDGAILLTSGAANGTTLATYTSAITALNTWYAFEFEVVINNATGSFAVRKNGNTSNDFSASSLNTRAGTANNYANRLGMGGVGTTPLVDDLLWRSDAASVPWVGDIRCYTRRPDTDAAAAWTRPGTFQMQPYFGTTTSTTLASGTPRYSRFISQGGTIGSVILNMTAGFTGNIKCAIYASTATTGGGQPGAVTQSATAPVTNPVNGANTFTFSPAVSITKGTEYFVAICSDTSFTNGISTASTAPYSNAGFTSATAYASFPAASPSASASASGSVFPVVTPTYNADAVSEPYEDAAASYVYSSTVGQADLYTLTGIDSTPTSIIGVTTRALAQKSDAGTRIITADLQSGATKVSSGPGVLNSGVWGWVYRTDLTDPATGAAWTPVGVNNARIGVTVTS